MAAAPKELAKSLCKLSLDQDGAAAAATPKTARKKKDAVADSWEDENVSSSEETDGPLSEHASSDYPSAPPPTPISPTPSAPVNFVSPFGYTAEGSGPSRSERSIRPEKTDAVAKRVIASALGLKPPKKTEEQKAYDRAMKEKEIKRRNAENAAAKRAQEETEKAKAAIWTD